MDANSSTKIKAHISVVPVKSQVFLIMLSLMAFASLVCSYFSRESNISWAFLAFSLVCVIGSLWAWRHGQSDIDLDQGHPTTLDFSGGLSFSTDSRILRNPDSLDGLAKMLESVLHRKPLPEPSGLINEKKEVIAGSQATAAAKVEVINNENQEIANRIIDDLGIGDVGRQVTQNSLNKISPPEKF